MKTTYYSTSTDAEMCYPYEHFKELAKDMFTDDPDLKEIILYEWNYVRGTGTFWCTEVGEGFESSEDQCGMACDFYEPRNGKNGICKHHRSPMDLNGQRVVIRRNEVLG